MFLLRRLAVRGVPRISSSDKFGKPAKLRNSVLSTFSNDFHILVSGEKTPNSCHKEVIFREYSNEVIEKAEVLGTVNDMGEEVAGMTDALFEEIANGDPQVLRKLKLLQFEVEVLRQSEKNVPLNMRKKHWEYLLTLNSMCGRKKYLVFLFKNEKRLENRKEKKKLQREEYLKKIEEGLVSDPWDYNLSNQSLFLRIYNKSLNQALTFRNELSQDIAQNIVFDCSYQEYMSSLNSKFCAIQLLYCLNLNLLHRHPCFIRLCNLKKEDYLYSILPKYILNVFDESFPWEIHENSYLDLYPKEKLVYLTPHCNEPLLKLNPGDVYIIGAFVDKGCGVKASLARAKKHKLRMAKLPLDEHIKWKQGTKSLPLNIVLKILLDMKFSKNWSTALKTVPRRHYEGLDYNVSFKNSDNLLV